ncbi:MAG: LysE family translocator [Hyphomicrobiales bacterium]|nr:LysE family translocator [Hyphomicrobiales bacterium]
MFGWDFLLTTMIVVVSPGAGVVYTLAAGLGQGARASAVAAFGCTLGIVPHLLAALFGLAALLHASAVAFAAVKWAGVAYLMFMAWKMLTDGGGFTVAAEHHRKSDFQVIRDGVVVNLLNPKLSIFFVAFLPQFMRSDDPHPLVTMSALGGFFMVATLVVFVIYGLFAASVRDHVIGRPRVLAWMRRSFAAAFLGIGAKLALSER